MSLTMGTSTITNTSGYPILRESGSILKVQHFITDAGSTTTSVPVVNMNQAGFAYTPVSTNSTLFLFLSAYVYMNGPGGYASNIYGYYGIGEYNGSVYVQISNTAYMWSYEYSSTYSQSQAQQGHMIWSSTNSSTSVRTFDMMAGITSANMDINCTQIMFRVMEVAA